MMKTMKLKSPKKERIPKMSDDPNMDAFLEISVILTIGVLAMIFIAVY